MFIVYFYFFMRVAMSVRIMTIITRWGWKPKNKGYEIKLGRPQNLSEIFTIRKCEVLWIKKKKFLHIRNVFIVLEIHILHSGNCLDFKGILRFCYVTVVCSILILSVHWRRFPDIGNAIGGKRCGTRERVRSQFRFPLINADQNTMRWDRNRRAMRSCMK